MNIDLSPGPSITDPFDVGPIRIFKDGQIISLKLFMRVQ